MKRGQRDDVDDFDDEDTDGKFFADKSLTIDQLVERWKKVNREDDDR